MMIRQIVNVNWRYIGDAVPAFVTIMFIPFGYSTAYGLIAGIMVYAALNGPVYLTKLISRGRIAPDDEDHREYWTLKPQGKLPWFITAGQTVAGKFGRGGEHEANSSESLGSANSREQSRSLSTCGSNNDLESVIAGMPKGEKR